MEIQPYSKEIKSSVEISAKQKMIRGLKPFKKGVSGNPKGHTKGQKNYATLYREALLKLGKAKGITPEQLEIDILSSGILHARKGDYRFYKDVLDRTHGAPKQIQDPKENENKTQINILITTTQSLLNGNSPQTIKDSANESLGVQSVQELLQ